MNKKIIAIICGIVILIIAIIVGIFLLQKSNKSGDVKDAATVKSVTDCAYFRHHMEAVCGFMN